MTRKKPNTCARFAVKAIVPFIFGFWVVSSLSAAGSDYFVSTKGDDSGPGTESQPWRTIQHAAENANAGDTIFIRGGIYNEYVHTVNSGSASEGPIVFRSYQDEKPIIDGEGVDANNGIIIHRNYIKLMGLEIRNFGENAVWVENAAHFEISDCIVYQVGCGIGISDGSHDFVLNRVEAHHFDLYGFDASPAGGGYCFNGTFNDCVAHTGRSRDQNVDGFALGHGDQHDFVLNRCEAYNIFDGFDISARNSTLNRCKAYDCWNCGYKLWQNEVKLINCLGYHNSNANVELDWDGQPGTVTLQNCTFMDSESFNIWIENSGDTLRMFNCILAGGDNIGLAFEQRDTKNYRGDYNIFHNDNEERGVASGYEDEFTLDDIAGGKWTTFSGQDAHSIVVRSAASLFTDDASFDLHLLPTSPAVDKGTSAGAPAEDFDGTRRPVGTGIDIGAYEAAFEIALDFKGRSK